MLMAHSTHDLISLIGRPNGETPPRSHAAARPFQPAGAVSDRDFIDTAPHGENRIVGCLDTVGHQANIGVTKSAATDLDQKLTRARRWFCDVLKLRRFLWLDQAIRDHLFISFDSASLVCFSLPNNSSTSVSATDIPNYAGLDFFR